MSGFAFGFAELIIVLAAAFIIFTIIVGVKQGFKSSSPINRQFDLTLIDSQAAFDPEVQELLMAGKKIEAIKRYRILSGRGLKESKDALEYLLAHPEYVPESKNKEGAAPLDAGLRELLRQGKRDEALKAYQSFTGVSKEDAELEIERLMWEEEQAHGRSGNLRR